MYALPVTRPSHPKPHQSCMANYFVFAPVALLHNVASPLCSSISSLLVWASRSAPTEPLCNCRYPVDRGQDTHAITAVMTMDKQLAPETLELGLTWYVTGRTNPWRYGFKSRYAWTVYCLTLYLFYDLCCVASYVIYIAKWPTTKNILYNILKNLGN